MSELFGVGFQSLHGGFRVVERWASGCCEVGLSLLQGRFRVVGH